MTLQKRHAYLVSGIVGLVLAAAYLEMAFHLPFGQMDRPGAAVFPVFVGIVLVVASLATVWEGWRMESTALIHLPGGADLWRLLAFLGLLFGYFCTLPWLGQIVAGTLFSILLMRLLSQTSWLRIAIYSVVLSLAIDLIFERLLAVPLPLGVIGF